MKAWHWLRADGCLNYKPHTKVVVGETLKIDLPIELCARGFHASEGALDALRYAPGPICCRVELGGTIKTGNDKVVATERTVLWMFDATPVLHEMACISAETALLIANVDDTRCWEAIEAKRAWLRGEIDDAALAAAGAAAGAAARDAAWNAAWAAAGAAARDAARDAAWDAAGAAARDAARDAAWNAAGAAAGAAARAAAGAAAWDAALGEQNHVFELLLTEYAEQNLLHSGDST